MVKELVPDYIVTNSTKTKVELPKEVRLYIKELIKDLEEVKFIAFSTGRRKLMNVFIRFAMNKSAYKFRYTIHETFEEAVASVKKEIEQEKN